MNSFKNLSMVVLAFVGFGMANLATADHSPLQELSFDRSAIVIETRSERYTLKVEVAETPSQRMQGLQFRHEIGDTDGMLFDFGSVRPVSMWMKNTQIPLDMLFIDQNGLIKRIVARTTPWSLDQISSGMPVRAVLELAAGRAKDLDIVVGDRVEHPIFTQTH